MSTDERSRTRSAGRTVVAITVTAAVVALAWILFVRIPGTLAELLGVLAVVLVAPLAARVGSSLAGRAYPGYNVAEVAVEGPITRSAGGGVITRPIGADADRIVDQVERADADDAVDALLVKLNTPGGEIVPSADIRNAVSSFDGPTVAYATDVCASGGYDIASGCDELWARTGSIVGSIGVIGSQVNVSDLADRLGVSYEQFTAGEYKDAGVPLKGLDEDEREYLQGIVDDYYEEFVTTVAEGRELDEETVRETEARVFLGADAADRGLVDAIGTREDVENRLADRLDEPVSVESFEPEPSLPGRFRGGAASTAYAFGAGIASVVDDQDGFEFRL